MIENLRSYSSRAILVRLIVGKMLRNVIVFRQPQSFCTKATKSRAQTHPPSAHHALAVRAGGADVSRLRESAIPPQGKRHPSAGKAPSLRKESAIPPAGNSCPACGKPHSRRQEGSFPPAGNVGTRRQRRLRSIAAVSEGPADSIAVAVSPPTECPTSTVVDGRQCSRATPSFG